MRTLRLAPVGALILVLLVGLGGRVVTQAKEEGPASIVHGTSPEGGSPVGIDAPGTTTFTEIEGVPYLTYAGDTITRRTSTCRTLMSPRRSW